MRKKLLRSRSGFEKPESREEAIMQNILGASNVLEPSESNIEEILKSILYNTPYTKEAEFEIEKILLAIKNNGTYDGECESRDLKILFAILKDLDYTEEAQSRIEELFIEWLYQRSSIKVLEGVPPLTFTAHGLPLINYLIEGNTVQNGTPTPDNPIMPQGTGELETNLAIISDDSQTVKNGYYKNVRISDVLEAGTYTVTYVMDERTGNVSSSSVGFGTLNIYQKDMTHITIANVPLTITATVTLEVEGCLWARFLRAGSPINFSYSVSRIRVEKGSHSYGYKIPISSANTTTPVYLGEVETTRKIRKLVLTGEEDWLIHAENYYIRVTNYYNLYDIGANLTICSHFENRQEAHVPDGYYSLGGLMDGETDTKWNGNIVFNPKPLITTKQDWVNYLSAQYAAGTPVCVWYVLANEKTAVVNEPLRKIGAYVDSISKAQAGVEIPTANGSNTLDVDTTLKPSNIYIEYK